MAGRLVRNSADRNGVAPYVLLDRGGVVRGYVTPSEGMDLQPYCGRPVTLVGSIAPSKKDQPPRLVAEHVLDSARTSATPRSARAWTVPPRDVAVRQVAFQAEGTAGIRRDAEPRDSGSPPSGFPTAHGIRPSECFGGPGACGRNPSTIGSATRATECDWTARFTTVCGRRPNIRTAGRCAVPVVWPGMSVLRTV